MFLEIENLARHKSFSALSAAERKMVLAEMSEADYRRLYDLVHGLRQMQAEVRPPLALKERLMKQAALGAKRRTWPGAILLFFVFALFSLASMILWQVSKPADIPALVPAHRPAPVVEPKAVVLEPPIIQGKKVKRPGKLQVKPAAAAHTNYQPPAIPEPTLIPSPTGASLGDNPELLEFFTGS